MGKPKTEVKAEPDDIMEIAKLALGKLSKLMAGESKACIACDREVREFKQYGRSVYALPCGCRQYQGTITEEMLCTTSSKAQPPDNTSES